MKRIWDGGVLMIIIVRGKHALGRWTSVVILVPVWIKFICGAYQSDLEPDSSPSSVWCGQSRSAWLRVTVIGKCWCTCRHLGVMSVQVFASCTTLFQRPREYCQLIIYHDITLSPEYEICF